jgi:hypothetical protein
VVNGHPASQIVAVHEGHPYVRKDYVEVRLGVTDIHRCRAAVRRPNLMTSLYENEAYHLPDLMFVIYYEYSAHGRQPCVSFRIAAPPARSSPPRSVQRRHWPGGTHWGSGFDSGHDITLNPEAARTSKAKLARAVVDFSH